MRRSAQRHHNTRHLGLRASSSPDDEDAVSVSDLVEMEVGGVSISPAGFVALLVPAGKASALAPAPNPVEALRSPSQPLPAEIADLPILPVLITEGVDVDGAVSEYAQAMLQLLQDPPCDMGIQLPYDALDKITGGNLRRRPRRRPHRPSLLRRHRTRARTRHGTRRDGASRVGGDAVGG